MAWTNTNAPGTDTPEGRRDFVRLNLGDIVEADPLVTDEAIAAALVQTGDDVWLATAILARAIAAQFARASDISMGEGALAISDRAVFQGFMELAKRMERQAKKYGARDIGLPYGGGLTISELELRLNDTDFNRPAFTENDFENPGIARDDATSSS